MVVVVPQEIEAVRTRYVTCIFISIVFSAHAQSCYLSHFPRVFALKHKSAIVSTIF